MQHLLKDPSISQDISHPLLEQVKGTLEQHQTLQHPERTSSSHRHSTILWDVLIDLRNTVTFEENNPQELAEV